MQPLVKLRKSNTKEKVQKYIEVKRERLQLMEVVTAFLAVLVATRSVTAQIVGDNCTATIEEDVQRPVECFCSAQRLELEW